MRKKGEIHTLKVEITDPEAFMQVTKLFMSGESTSLGFRLLGIAYADYFKYLEPRCECCSTDLDTEKGEFYLICKECESDGLYA